MPAHTLVLLRHGKSDWSSGESDLHRPLATRGRRQAAQAGRWLGANLSLDLAVVSPAERARRTWELASAELETAPPTRVEERAYAASARSLLELVHELPADVATAVLVGHNPGLEDLIETLTGRWVLMKTSGVAVITLPGAWSSAGDAAAELGAFGRPPTSGSA